MVSVRFVANSSLLFSEGEYAVGSILLSGFFLFLVVFFLLARRI